MSENALVRERFSARWGYWSLAPFVAVLFIPAFTFGSSYILGLAVSLLLMSGIWLLLLAFGLKTSNLAGLLVSSVVAILMASFLAVLNASSLSIPLSLFLVILSSAILCRRRIEIHRLIVQSNSSPYFKGNFLVVGILSAFAWIQISGGILTNGSVDSGKLTPDVPLLVSFVRSIGEGGGLTTPFIDGFEMRYHWLSYAFSAWFTDVSGMDPIAVTFVVVPFLSFIVGLLLAGVLAGLVIKSNWAPIFGIVSLALVGSVGIWRYIQSTPWEWFSPSTVVGGLFGLALSVALLGKVFPNIYFQTFLVSVLGVGVGLAKVSMGVVVAGSALIVGILVLIYPVLRAQYSAIPFAAVPISVGLAAASTFSDTGNSLGIDPIWGEMLGANHIRIVEILGSEISFITASIFLWAGVILVLLTRSWKQITYLWALAAGLIGQFLFLSLAAVDRNDRFFSIAGLTIAIPIFATLILKVKVRREKFSLLSVLMVLAFVLISAWVLALAAWSPYFDLRPLLMLTLIVGLSVIFALLTSHMIDAPRKLNAGATSVAVFLMTVSVIFPQVFKMLDSEETSTEAGLLVNEVLSNRSVESNLAEWRFELSGLNTKLLGSSPVAIWSSSETPIVIARWAIYELKPSIYVSSEPDLDRLSTRQAQLVSTERRALVDEALSGSEGAQADLCFAGVKEIVTLGPTTNMNVVSVRSERGITDLGILPLDCESL